MNITVVLLIVIGVVGVGAAAEGYLLKKSYERIGSLEQANKSLTEAINAKVSATRGRAQTDEDVRRLPPDDVLKRLQ